MQSTDVVQIYQAMSALARKLDAVNLAQGIPEPTYDADWRTAISAELAGSHFQYTPTRGDPALREAVAALYAAATDEVLATSGCTESLTAALIGLAELGSTTAVWLEPFYSYYPGMARIAGLTHRSVPIDLSGPRPTLDHDRLRDAVAPLGERAVILLNTPHNPSGLVLDDSDWAAVLSLIETTGCFVLLDDAYRDFRYGAPAAPYAALLATGRAAVAGSVSKSLAATGIRLGWLLAPSRLRDVAEHAHMHMSNCAPELVQKAATRLLRTVQPRMATHVCLRYQHKRDLLLAGLATAGLRTLTPDGGHFVMALPPEDLDRRTGTELAFAFAPEAGVVPLPLESFFHRPGQRWLRFSFAVSQTDLDTACDRLAGYQVVRS